MKKALILACCLVLGGCFFSTKNSTFYMLESIDATTYNTQKKFKIAIQDVRIADYLQKPQIVLQKENSPMLEISEFNRWGSDLEGMVQNVMIEDMQALLPKSSVKPLLYGNSADYIIKVNIEKMRGYFLEKAELKGTWQILSAKGKLLKSRDFSLKTDAGKTYASYVKAQSGLVYKLSEDIVSNI